MSSLRLPVETAHLLLRPFERGDVDAVSRYHTLPAVQRYIERPTRYDEDVAAAIAVMRKQVGLQRPGETLTLAMVRKGDHRLIGQVSLKWSDATASQGEVRFAIDPAQSGKGYLTEALTALIDLAFDHFRIHRIMVRCDGRSHHSVKLMQKLGFRLEAHYREHALFQGEWDEELHFAVLDREWRPSAKVLELPLRDRVA
ncbi:GNAT family N-acetyltransferase [Devosia sp. XJ19-1]|uniref:GNAT family N-acetyltransferase n=1 Tax=Devosia ureilytica TaxID=2952754 RepID=A0A9Q4AMV8_9HYPH|nr:GNAT family protein [Devosia ureilytica]MCP8883481.1 GNAT family N-acetyltransferase [Devosia ureilytica]MCP8887089.1 GNAT family N-acetyltransferase [Devosia ureilytica]